MYMEDGIKCSLSSLPCVMHYPFMTYRRPTVSLSTIRCAILLFYLHLSGLLHWGWWRHLKGHGEKGHEALLSYSYKITTKYTETEMSSFWWNFHHCLHWKLSKWQLPVQPVIKISSKWRHFRFSVQHYKTVSYNTLLMYIFLRLVLIYLIWVQLDHLFVKYLIGTRKSMRHTTIMCHCRHSEPYG